MKLYHGTSESLAVKALKDGLQPRSVTQVSHWEHTAESHPDGIYLTDAYPLYFSIQAANGTGVPGERLAVLEVDTSLLDPQKLCPDEDVLEAVNRGKDHLPRDWDMGQRVTWYRDHLPDYAGKHGVSLKAMGTCCHLGAIPAEAITRVAYLDYKVKSAAQIAYVAMDALISVANYRFVGGRHKAVTDWLFQNPIEVDEATRMMEADLLQALETQSREGIELVDLKPQPTHTPGL